ncbi:MAG TPA: LysR substrate-binding domain-containing protein [Steroidobacteraceae bacterium]
MELRHLRYFVAVAEEMSFRRAAVRLHIAPPPLSVQIQKLEAEIGTELFYRKGRSIALTKAGEVFLEHARKTLVTVHRGVELTRQTAHGDIGQLSIGYNAPSGFLVFPRIIPAFKARWPDVHLTFHSHSIAVQLHRLLRDELDLGFVWLPIDSDKFDVQPLVEEPLVAVLPAQHPLAANATVSIKSLSREPLILLSRALDPDTYHEIGQLFRSARATMNVVYELENSLSMINFVAMGCGCSLLPRYTEAIRQHGVVHRALKPPAMVKTLAMVKRKDRQDLAETFFRFATETMQVTGNSQ